ncbi:DUF6599 family protein [Silvibacterium dinghuense]|uniref:Uncharacterized protein n=1 Tax=Silvibacterium dinghuense TaxID=1560006 RepID=A0A4Q1S9G0_9BACT|nr:DUF6599 family protein [Silvibacterium dinghuense]RXS93693.1 hypothetical protein ESZ00_16685 [Silvibacterium dinghuense]GGH06863.1 hypothetical protein GCM10011586_23830 [Silvibacterium dinghuense]
MPALVVLAGVVSLGAPVLEAQGTAVASSTAAVQSAIALPATLGGWQLDGAAQTGTDPAQLDAAQAGPLKEYGLKGYAAGTYRHGGATLAVKLLRFPDATGAYGAFTLYRTPAMHPADFNLEKGHEAAVGDGTAIFWTGTEVVTAAAAHIGFEEREALTALAAALPKNYGPDGVAPPLPKYLPDEGLDRSSVRYAIGPEGYVAGGGALPSGTIDFSQDAEVVTGRYGAETLTVVGYPTPQIAAGSEKSLETLLKGAGASGSLQNALAKHTGPLMAVVSGPETPSNAQKLLDRVKYEAQVTADHPEGYGNEVKKTARLLVGIVTLTLILGGAALLLGIFLGGGRALYRVLRGKPVSTLNDDDFISLKLE